MSGVSTECAGALPNPLIPGTLIRGVLFDVDGTLYRQRPLRLAMALELTTLPLRGRSRALRHIRALRAYRHAQEELRLRGVLGDDDAQLTEAARAANVSVAEVREAVDEWMLRRPLKYMRVCRAAKLMPLLTFLRRSNVAVGALSDYPATEKLRALGLSEHFSPVLCSTDGEIRAFKPNPRGLLRACSVWQLEPAHVLMVGDRADVDGEAARAAGMPCVIVGRSESASTSNWLVLRSFERLHRMLENHD